MTPIDPQLDAALDEIVEGIYRWTTDMINQGPLKDRPILGTGKAPLLKPSEAKARLAGIVAEREQAAQKQNILLKADIAYAIGKFEGLGYPSEYLKRRYPEFKKWVDIDKAALRQQKGTES